MEKDRKLVESAKENPQEFAVLYDKYVEQIYKYVFRRVQDKEQTEDLVSQTFFDALEHLESYEFRGYAFSAWLYKIAHNNVLKWYREKTRGGYRVDMEEMSNLKDEKVELKDEVNTLLEKSELMQSLDLLDDEEREIIRLKYFEEVSNIELAHIMGITANNVGVKLYRALRKLKQLIENNN